ncbi:MAG: hypothetical protein HON53_07855 [Planctomycetaceae bacterium]|jgi:hypothetical protein|nr:hypothetical protein [Planctomycetaceae bacterium]MBT6156991.1 hypothetical protein [Planctomycetaceae bacterium]MBT6484205.1 hypothetical protein [Planctomycetaceae bacterium]MBT6495010.1 hypothetical protein [Planctomycetaceae bacterium]
MFNSDLTGLIAVCLIFGGPVLCFLVGIIVNGWVKAARNREQTELKHRLVEADFSADEIERILNAGRGSEKVAKATDNMLADTEVGPKIRVG